MGCSHHLPQVVGSLYSCSLHSHLVLETSSTQLPVSLIGYKVRITVMLPGSQFHLVQNPRSRAYRKLPAAHPQQPPYATSFCSSLRFLFVSTQILPVLSLSPSQSQLCICADLQFFIPLATQLPCCPARSMTLLLGLTLSLPGQRLPSSLPSGHPSPCSRHNVCAFL